MLHCGLHHLIFLWLRSLYRIHSRSHSTHVLLSHPTYPRVNLARMQTGTRLNTRPLTDHHLKHDVYILPPLFFFSPAPRLSPRCTAQSARPAHKDAEAPARARKAARLVGAAAAALVRSPRVAPGARLPVVCQRLRVEFIQIKAVE